jgi:hypothetical protein
VALVGALLRPDLVTDNRDRRLVCDTSADPLTAGTVRPADDDPRPMVNVVMAMTRRPCEDPRAPTRAVA